MFRSVTLISSLLFGMAVLMSGTGLLGTALALRAGAEAFSPAVTGVVMSAYFIGYVAGTFLCPGIIRQVGPIRAFAAMASVASAAILCHAMLVNPPVWFLLRVFSGVCMVGMYMAVESWLNVLASNTDRGRLFAAYQVVCLASLAVGQFLVLVGDIAGYVPFALSSVLISLSLVPVALTTVQQPGPVPSARVSLSHLYDLSPSAMSGAFGSGLLNGTLWGVGPLFAHLSGRTEGGVAAFMAAVIVGGALLQWPVGWVSDRYDRRVVLAGVGLLGACFAGAVAWSSSGPVVWTMVTGFLYGGMAFSVYSLSVAHMNDMVEPHDALEAARGMLLAHGVGAMLGPMAGGYLMGRFGPGSLMVFLACSLVMVGLVGLARRQVREAPEGEEHVEFVPMLRTSQAAMELDPRLEDALEESSRDASGEAEERD